MSTHELYWMSVTALAAAIRAKDISSVEALDNVMDRIATHIPALNAIVTLDVDGARTRAQQADVR